MEKAKRPVAILSSTVLPLDGLYAVIRCDLGSYIDPTTAVGVPVPALESMAVDAYAQGVDVPVSDMVYCTMQGVPHYVGHPSTKEIVESHGAVQASEKLFPGLKVGEAALSVGLKQGRSTRASQGFTSPHQDVTQADLDIRVILMVL